MTRLATAVAPAIAPVAYADEVAALLTEANLPFDDLQAGHPVRLFGTRLDAELCGVVGLERYGSVGLLRSLAVSPRHRGLGLGRALVAHAETQAAAQGMDTLYLLTTTAEQFFETLGYARCARGEAPAAIAATPQFSALCPSSSAFMRRKLAR